MSIFSKGKTPQVIEIINARVAELADALDLGDRACADIA
jgi:hypothetical protein